jgi:hypothetical protein
MAEERIQMLFVLEEHVFCHSGGKGFDAEHPQRRGLQFGTVGLSVCREPLIRALYGFNVSRNFRKYLALGLSIVF